MKVSNDAYSLRSLQSSDDSEGGKTEDGDYIADNTQLDRTWIIGGFVIASIIVILVGFCICRRCSKKPAKVEGEDEKKKEQDRVAELRRLQEGSVNESVRDGASLNESAIPANFDKASAAFDHQSAKSGGKTDLEEASQLSDLKSTQQLPARGKKKKKGKNGKNVASTSLENQS